jgi:hypothetical protein
MKAIHQFMMSRIRVLTQVLLNVKMADYVKRRSISVKGNNVAESTGCSSYNS